MEYAQQFFEGLDGPASLTFLGLLFAAFLIGVLPAGLAYVTRVRNVERRLVGYRAALRESRAETEGLRGDLADAERRLTDERRARAQVEEEQVRDWSGGGCILLVEDEDMVRAVAERALQREGYSIVTASDGDEGLELFAAEPDKFDLVVTVKGGGTHGQAIAIRHAISRALTLVDPENRKLIKPLGFLTRDPRMKERKKPGQPGARKRFQFSKR